MKVIVGAEGRAVGNASGANAWIRAVPVAGLSPMTASLMTRITPSGFVLIASRI